MLSPSIKQLIKNLTCLPGVGSKSAQRMVLHLLEREREAALALAKSLEQVMLQTKNCTSCRNFTELELCDICQDVKRDKTTLCVVETPSDVMAIEHSGSYEGLFFVLMGHLSPLDGIGPDELGIHLLLERVDETVEEVILATNPTVEGEATATFIAELLSSKNVEVTRIAHGVPMGGELEFVDGGTLAHALSSRQKY